MTAGLLAPRPPFCRAQNLVGQPALPTDGCVAQGDCGLWGIDCPPYEERGAASQAFTVLFSHSAPQEPS